MTELARPRLIDSAALDARNYFTSLMEQAGRRGLTGTEDRARLLSALSAAAEGLYTGLDCTALERGYVMRSLPRLAGTLERALRWGHLSAIVPRPVEEA